MSPLDIAQAVAVVVLVLIALVALSQIIDWSRCLGYLKRRKEKHEVELPGLRQTDDSGARD